MACLRLFALVLVLMAGYATATDIFVRPLGCPLNVRLVADDSYRELINQTIAQCAAQCIADGTWCRSFSFYDNPTNSTKTCSLNLGHADQVWSGLRYAQFWTYYERITEETGLDNFGIADISTCQPNTFRDCRTAYLATSNGNHRQIWLKLDNLTYPIPGYCRSGQDILMLQRTGIGFYDISWNRPWEEYKYGFGRDINNFWFGLDTMYRIINQDVVYRFSGNRCLFPRKINGTTTRMTLSDQLQSRCPWWSTRADGTIVLSMRSLCICEDTVNAGGIGHVRLCGCNEPDVHPFIWSPTFSQIISPRPNGGNRCLKITADSAGEEVVVADCDQANTLQLWTQQRGRYRNYWGGWDLNNNYRESSAVHTEMYDEPAYYKIHADPIFSCGCLSCKVQQWYGFSTYDKDRDGESAYNMALRQAGGDWWYTNSYLNDPRLTSQKDASQYSFCNNWLINSFMSLQADDYWY